MIYVCRRYSHVTRQNQWFHLISATLGVLRAETLLAFSTLFESVWCNMSMLSFPLSVLLVLPSTGTSVQTFFSKFLQFLSSDGRLMPSSRKIHAQWLHRSLGAHLETSEERPRHFSLTLRTSASEEDEKNVRVGSVFKSQEFNCLYYSIPG